jgi:hypothetical protein
VTAYKNLDHSNIVPVQYQQMIGYQHEQWQSSASGSFRQFRAWRDKDLGDATYVHGVKNDDK